MRVNAPTLAFSPRARRSARVTSVRQWPRGLLTVDNRRGEWLGDSNGGTTARRERESARVVDVCRRFHVKRSNARLELTILFSVFNSSLLLAVVIPCLHEGVEFGVGFMMLGNS